MGFVAKIWKLTRVWLLTIIVSLRGLNFKAFNICELLKLNRRLEKELVSLGNLWTRILLGRGLSCKISKDMNEHLKAFSPLFHVTHVSATLLLLQAYFLLQLNGSWCLKSNCWCLEQISSSSCVEGNSLPLFSSNFILRCWDFENMNSSFILW